MLLHGADEQFPRLEPLWVDQGYTGSGKHWIEAQLGWNVEVVRHPPQPRGEWVPHGDRSDWRTVWFSWERLPPAPKVLRGVACCPAGGWSKGPSPGSVKTGG